MGIIYAQQGYYIYYTCFRHMWWQIRSKCLLSQERKGNYITFHHSISTLNMFHSNLASNLSLSTDKSKKWGVIRVESPVVIFSKVEPYLLNPKIKNSFFNLYHNQGGKGGRVSHIDIFQEHQLNWKKPRRIWPAIWCPYVWSLLLYREYWKNPINNLKTVEPIINTVKTNRCLSFFKKMKKGKNTKKFVNCFQCFSHFKEISRQWSEEAFNSSSQE